MSRFLNGLSDFFAQRPCCHDSFFVNLPLSVAVSRTTCMMMRLGTRKSALAMAQAEIVCRQLIKCRPDVEIEVVGITTRGDRIQDVPLAAIGGKGLFLKEIEEALLDGRIDFAVHSMKDVPAQLARPFQIAAILERGNPLDAFVSTRFEAIDQLPHGARIGTSSPRRKAILRGRYPHVEILDLRGNINTRLTHLAEGNFDAIILAAVGLERLELDDQIRHLMAAEVMLPSAGQGAIGIECLGDADRVVESLQPLNHGPTRSCVDTERLISAQMGGSCHLPLGAFATINEQTLLDLKAVIGDPESGHLVFSHATGSLDRGSELASEVVEDLLCQGADEILQRVNAIE